MMQISIDVIKSHVEPEKIHQVIEGVVRKSQSSLSARHSRFASTLHNNIAVTRLYLPLWVLVFEVRINRLFLKDYRMYNAVGVDAWLGQVGSLGTIPGKETMNVDIRKVLEKKVSKEQAETEGKEYLQDYLIVTHRKIPKISLVEHHLMYQPIWISFYEKNGKKIPITVDGVSGRQIFRFGKKIFNMCKTVEPLNELLSKTSGVEN